MKTKNVKVEDKTLVVPTRQHEWTLSEFAALNGLSLKTARKYVDQVAERAGFRYTGSRGRPPVTYKVKGRK